MRAGVVGRVHRRAGATVQVRGDADQVVVEAAGPRVLPAQQRGDAGQAVGLRREARQAGEAGVEEGRVAVQTPSRLRAVSWPCSTSCRCSVPMLTFIRFRTAHSRPRHNPTAAGSGAGPAAAGSSAASALATQTMAAREPAVGARARASLARASLACCAVLGLDDGVKVAVVRHISLTSGGALPPLAPLAPCRHWRQGRLPLTLPQLVECAV